MKNVMTGLRGFWGYRGTLSDIWRYYEGYSFSQVHRQHGPVTYTHMYKNIIFKTSINIVNIVCESITILIPGLIPWFEYNI